jgi:hypothetical protein
MKKTTNIKVPKKYQHMIDEIEQDSDGYWAYSKYGFYFEYMGNECHTAHEDTKTDLLKVIRSLKPCNCKECQEELNK